MRVRIVGGFLGAGKTSAIRELAKLLAARGERVCVVTNDQGRALVDTELVRPSAEWVREIGGGCFCCQFDDLEAALGAAAGAGATVAIAEAVGSCTDLVATVVSPLAERAPERFHVEPLSIVVDPWRLREVVTGAFHDDVAYLHRKQIEEADVVVLSRSDLAPPDVEAEVRALAPNASIVAVSSVNGNGFADWIAARPVRPAPPLVIDYDRYAAAEAGLGWLNARATISSVTPFAPSAILGDVFARLGDLAIAHLKVACIAGEGRGSAALVRRGGSPTFELGALAPTVTELALTINARVAITPRELEARVRGAVEGAAGFRPVVWSDLAAFEPARPVPIHRHTYRCGSGDDASCCAAFYDRPEVGYLLGDSLHPGGLESTLTLARQLGLHEGATLLDVACGRGTSLRAIVAELPVSAVGVDKDCRTPAREDRLSTLAADAHALPFEAAAFDGVLCECALSTFARPRRVLLEIARVLRPGARVAVSDMIVEGPIPELLRPYAHTGACLAGARTSAGWNALFAEAGFVVRRATDASTGLTSMLAGIKRKLVGFALARAAGALADGVEVDVARGRTLVREAEATVAAGHVRYGTWILTRPSTNAAEASAW